MQKFGLRMLVDFDMALNHLIPSRETCNGAPQFDEILTTFLFTENI